MIKKFCGSEDNISNSVTYLLTGAKKRRANALMCANSVKSESGNARKLVAIN